MGGGRVVCSDEWDILVILYYFFFYRFRYYLCNFLLISCYGLDIEVGKNRRDKR